MGSIRVTLEGRRLRILESGRHFDAIPSMEHEDFQRILKRGWVSPPSFGPAGDLRIYSAAHPAKPDEPYQWFASADWRRGRIQVDRQGAITDLAMEPYGGGSGKVRGEPVDLALDYARCTLSITVGERHSAIGRWSAGALALEADDGAAATVEGALAAAVFMWCAKPEAFLVVAQAPF